MFIQYINKVNNEQNNEEMTTNTVENQTINSSINVNPAVINPVVVVNPSIANPSIANPSNANPSIANSSISNPSISNPSIVNPIKNVIQNNRKRRALPSSSTSSLSSKRNCDYQKVTYIMKGNHVEICFDVERKNITEISPPSNFTEKVYEEARKMLPCKIIHGLKVQFENPENDIKEWYVSHRALEFEDDVMDKISPVLAEKISNYSEMGSGWKMVKILQFCFKIIKISAIPYLSGNNYIKSPERLEKSKSTINVKNYDNLCFIYSILAVQKYSSIIQHRERVSNYIPFLSTINFSSDEMPMKIKSIPNFERRNPQISINVLKYNNDVDNDENEDYDNVEIVKNPYIDLIYRSRNENGEQIHLLLLEKGNKYHYLAVSNLYRLLNLRVSDNVRIQCQVWCHKCFHGFRYQTGYEKHLPMCMSNNKITTLYRMPKQKFCDFTDLSKTVSPPYIVYADFESVLIPTTIHEHMHMPASAGLLLLGPNDSMSYQEFIGPQCIFNFLLALESITKTKVTTWYERSTVPMIPLTNQQKQDFDNATECYLCHNESEKYVRDHCHISGQFLGAACNKCNISRQIRWTLPVFFHNLKGYDMHHILKHAINNFSKYSLSIIPQTKEKFSTLSINMKTDRGKAISIKFLDSLQFLPASLKTLASNLQEHPITKTQFPSDIINGKGVFPYTYAKTFEQLENTKQLPPKWNDITDAEYNEAKGVWTRYGCTNLLEYMLIYMKLDIYLLADVFQQFRKQVQEEDGLEAANFISLPALSWTTAIRSCPSKVELIQDPEMYFFFQSGIRGGMTFVNKHRVTADVNTNLLYVDINNLYGWALSQPLPYGNFKWVTEESELNALIEKLPFMDTENEENGLVFEVDLTIPPEEHDKLDQLPLAPINQCPPGNKVK